MSVINNLPGAALPYIASPEPQSSGTQWTSGRAAPFGPADDAVAAPSWYAPGSGAPNGAYAPAANNGGWNLGSIMDFISNAVSGLFQQLGSMLSATAAPATAAVPGTSPQTYFAKATASSTGDPHLALDGTTASGAHQTQKWDSMTSHRDLLDSDSFAGGYRVSTKVTAPSANGITQNARAAVTTDGGATRVAMNADGSYDVRANGAAVTLQTGVATQLDGGERVTLNADKSLTVADDNGNGATVATTLRSNGGGGVDVTTTAQNADLGGYLVNRTEAPEPHGQPLPIAWPRRTDADAAPAAPYQGATFAQLPYAPVTSPPGDATDSDLQFV